MFISSLFELVLLASLGVILVGFGFWLGRRSSERFSNSFMGQPPPPQQMYKRTERQEYGNAFDGSDHRHSGYNRGVNPDGEYPYTQRQGYGSGYPMQQGMNPLMAGGLGAIGGGLLGYGLGQTMADGGQAIPDAVSSGVENVQQGVQDVQQGVQSSANDFVNADYGDFGSAMMDAGGFDGGESW